MKVAAILAHPDDIGQCIGTLIKCKERGDEVFVCHISGDCTKAENVASLCGFHLIDGGFDDFDVFPDCKEARQKVFEIIKNVNPDLIITHNPKDDISNREAVSKLVHDASYLVSKDIPIYYASTYKDTGFVPTEFVDITDKWETKKEALLSFEKGESFLHNAEVSAKFFGYQCGVKYAEVFAKCNTIAKAFMKRLLP